MAQERKTTATKAGYHFLSTYQGCRWKWHLRFNRKLVPVKTSRYLLFGQAFHMAKEAFYRREAATRDDFTLVGVGHLRVLADQYEYQDQFSEDLEKMTAMCREWWDTFAAREFDLYEVLAVEEEMKIDLPAGFVMTVRPDVVVRDRASGLVYAFETKTTTRSVSEMARSVACQQQVDTQQMGIEAKMAELGLAKSLMGGVIPDIVYRRQSVKRAERTAPIKRSPKEIADTKLSFAGLFAEIGQKVQTLAEQPDMPPELLFDRNGSWCAQFGCEYEPICKARWSKPPVGFRLDEE